MCNRDGFKRHGNEVNLNHLSMQVSIMTKKLMHLDPKKNYSYTEQSFGYEDNEGNSATWKVVDVIEHVKHLKVQSIEVDSFRAFLEYKMSTYDEEDWYRVKEASLHYPIIVGTGTFTFSDDVTKGRYPIVIDGVHRLVKSLLDKHRYIKAYVTSTLPPPKVTGKGFQLDGMKYQM